MTKAEKTARLILQATTFRPTLALILGSAFQCVEDAVTAAVQLPYKALPGFPVAKVDGHAGRLLVGEFGGVPVFTMCGRSHYYEGYALSEITFPVRVLAECGVQAVLLTNAAGGINPKLRTGDFMCITDHINFMGANPLQGHMGGKRTCFVDLGRTYDAFLNKLLVKAGRRARVRLQSGIYVAVAGPCYETPAEIRVFGQWGADAVGMSTVPEAIVARQCGLRVAGLSCITNPAAGLDTKPISHEEVLEMGKRVRSQAAALLCEFVRLCAGGKEAS